MIVCHVMQGGMSALVTTFLLTATFCHAVAEFTPVTPLPILEEIATTYDRVPFTMPVSPSIRFFFKRLYCDLDY